VRSFDLRRHRWSVTGWKIIQIIFVSNDQIFFVSGSSNFVNWHKDPELQSIVQNSVDEPVRTSMSLLPYLTFHVIVTEAVVFKPPVDARVWNFYIAVLES
jgi:hypothetical protein